MEWEIISAVHFGYSHYRHRCYVVAYMPDSKLGQSKSSAFRVSRERAVLQPNTLFPDIFNPENTEELINLAVAENPREIKLRTKRINSMGNSIVPDIAESIFTAITDAELGVYVIENPWTKENGARSVGHINNINPDDKFPQRGIMKDGYITTADTDKRLNPNKKKYELMSTIIAKDGNNNFTSKSRQSRPGKLGGLIASLQYFGARKGGLHPNFAEKYMGFPKDYTLLQTR